MGIIGINIMIYKQLLKVAVNFAFILLIKKKQVFQIMQTSSVSAIFQLKRWGCAFLRPIKAPHG